MLDANQAYGKEKSSGYYRGINMTTAIINEFTAPSKLMVEITDSDIRNATLRNPEENPIARAMRRTLRNMANQSAYATVDDRGITCEVGGTYTDYWLGPQARAFLRLMKLGKAALEPTTITFVRNGQSY